MIGEEMAFIPASSFFSVMLPIWEMTTMTMLLISSPQGYDSWFQQFLAARDDDSGETIADCVIMDLVCEWCAERGIPEKCRHVHETPPWKDRKKFSWVSKLSRKTEFVTESMGHAAGGETGFLSKTAVMDFITTEYAYHDMPKPKYVMVGCDPNTRGGQGNAEMAIVAMFPSYGRVVVSQKSIGVLFLFFFFDLA